MVSASSLTAGLSIRLLLIFTAAYVAAAGVGQALAIAPGVSIIMWPPAGLLSATLLLSRVSTWPAWVLAAGLAELIANALWFHNALGPALGYVGANAVEAMVGAALLRPVFAAPPRLETLRQVIAMLLVGAGLAPFVGAALGCALDAAVGKRAFAEGLPLWWLGDATGYLIVAPVALVGAQTWRRRKTLSAPRLAEAAAVLLLLLALAGAGFAGLTPTPYLVMPALLWASIRFGLSGAILGVIALALLASALALLGVMSLGSAAAPAAQMPARLQIFLGVSALSALVVAALSQGREQALRELRLSEETLERQVEARTGEAQASEKRLRMALEGARAGVWEWDVETGEAAWSPELFALFRRDPASRAPSWEALLEMAAPEERRRIAAVVDRASTEGGPFGLECRVRDADGRVLWVSILGLFEPQPSGRPRRAYGIALDVTARKQAEERATLLMQEVNHRAKNLLMLVQAIARYTAQGPDFLERFGARIAALAASQDLLVRDAWRAVSLGLLVRTQLQHFGDLLDRRIVLSGPPIEVNSQTAQTLGMAIHELATNASKYGALSGETGQVAISWRVADGRFELDWTETGGPSVAPPATQGFGSTVLNRMAQSALSAAVAVEHRPSGVRWTLECPLDKVQTDTF